MTAPQLAPLHEWTIEYVRNLPATEIEWLDFKESRWLTTEQKTFNTLSPYVSAFANYDGGYLVIGCKDPVSGMPLEFDEGVDFSMKNGIQGWLEDKIPPLVDPPISRISVRALPFSSGENVGIVVIRIEPSLDAPHQANDKIFYQRVGTKNKGLGTQHVMDIRNRRRHPRITVSLNLDVFDYEPKGETLGRLRWEIENTSDVFCRFAAFTLKAPSMLGGRALIYEEALTIDSDASAFKNYHLSIPPPRTPLFPRAKLGGEIPVRLSRTGWNPPHRTIEAFEIKAYADGAPVVEITILQSDVASIRDFHP